MSEGEPASPSREPPARPVGAVVQPCAREAADSWIEIEVLDCRGEPMPEEEYVLLSAGGARRRGVTDDRGRARIEHLEPGSCEVWLPRREPEDYCGDPTFVELCLLEEDGRTPRAGERFVARFDDGQQHEGTLDDRGRARLEGVPEGECELSFPDLGDEWVPA